MQGRAAACACPACRLPRTCCMPVHAARGTCVCVGLTRTRTRTVPRVQVVEGEAHRRSLQLTLVDRAELPAAERVGA